jgi:D-amino-acid oxidase
MSRSLTEANGIENVVYNREKDAQSATAQWFSGLLSSQPWFSDVVPDVRLFPSTSLRLES